MRSDKPETGSRGFTLAELLIALMILGEIATFTIPKIITSQSNGRYNAAAKEIASTVAAAYQQYTVTNGASSSVGIGVLTPYMNYVNVDSSTVINGNAGTKTCGSANIGCLVMHNGAFLIYNTAAYFSGSNTTNGVWFLVDPSGANDSILATGFVLAYNGRVLTYGDMDTTYTYNSGSGTATLSTGNANPSWFSW